MENFTVAFDHLNNHTIVYSIILLYYKKLKDSDYVSILYSSNYYHKIQHTVSPNVCYSTTIPFLGSFS